MELFSPSTTSCWLSSRPCLRLLALRRTRPLSSSHRCSCRRSWAQSWRSRSALSSTLPSSSGLGCEQRSVVWAGKCQIPCLVLTGNRSLSQAISLGICVAVGFILGIIFGWSDESIFMELAGTRWLTSEMYVRGESVRERRRARAQGVGNGQTPAIAQRRMVQQDHLLTRFHRRSEKSCNLSSSRGYSFRRWRCPVCSRGEHQLSSRRRYLGLSSAASGEHRQLLRILHHHGSPPDHFSNAGFG